MVSDIMPDAKTALNVRKSLWNMERPAVPCTYSLRDEGDVFNCLVCGQKRAAGAQCFHSGLELHIDGWFETMAQIELGDSVHLDDLGEKHLSSQILANMEIPIQAMTMLEDGWRRYAFSMTISLPEGGR
jgi:hypothetical protein